MRRYFWVYLYLGVVVGGCAPMTSPFPPPLVASQDLTEEEHRFLGQTIEEIRTEEGVVDASDAYLVQARVLQRALEKHNLSSKVDAKRFLRLMEIYF